MMLKRFVLLIDDDPVLIYIVEQQFKKQLPCDELLSFQSADEALDYLRNPLSTLPDLILLDINMPDKNGWDFLEIINDGSWDITRVPKVAILSSSVDPLDHTKSEKFSNVVSFLTKPLNLDTLKTILNNSTTEEVSQSLG